MSHHATVEVGEYGGKRRTFTCDLGTARKIASRLEPGRMTLAGVDVMKFTMEEVAWTFLCMLQVEHPQLKAEDVDSWDFPYHDWLVKLSEAFSLFFVGETKAEASGPVVGKEPA